MAQIIAFNVGRRNGKTLEQERLKALAKGRIRYFTCDDCGADIEVINEQYPDKCPGCGRVISSWKKSEENT